MSRTAADCLARIPDDDATVDLRGMLHSGRCRLLGEAEEGFVAVSTAYPFAVAWGSPGEEVVRAAIAGAGWEGAPEWHLMAYESALPAVEPVLAGWRRRGLAGACFALLAREMERRGKRPIWGAFDENAASLALAARLGFEPAARLVSLVRP